jgi:hypothetical protein
MVLHLVLLLLLLINRINSLDQREVEGVWTRISGTLSAISNDDGLSTRIPQSWSMGYASSGRTGYLYAGSSVGGQERVSDYLYRIDLDSAAVLRVSGSTFFNNIPASLPLKGVAGSTAPPPKDAPALWFAKDQGALYAFGGFSTYKRCFGNDFWKFNISANEWTWIDGDLSCDLERRKPRHGVKREFSGDNYPGAKYSTAYWENNQQGRLYMFAGAGAHFGSKNTTFENHVNVYFDGGDDVWVYDLNLGQWAWIAGSSTPNALPISTAPGDPVQTPGALVGDLSFGKSVDSGIWLLGPGSSNTFWLWKFDSSL